TCVFRSERLQNQVRHLRVEHVRIDLLDDVEPALEADALNVEVTAKKLKLLLQRHFLHARGLERVTQQLTQPRNHPANPARIALDQARHGVQCVEQEVGVDLHLKRAQTRLRKLSVKF